MNNGYHGSVIITDRDDSYFVRTAQTRPVSPDLDANGPLQLSVCGCTCVTHLTLKCFVSNGQLDIRTGVTAALLCRLLGNKRGRY